MLLTTNWADTVIGLEMELQQRKTDAQTDAQTSHNIEPWSLHVMFQIMKILFFSSWKV